MSNAERFHAGQVSRHTALGTRSEKLKRLIAEHTAELAKVDQERQVVGESVKHLQALVELDKGKPVITRQRAEGSSSRASHA